MDDLGDEWRGSSINLSTFMRPQHDSFGEIVGPGLLIWAPVCILLPFLFDLQSKMS